jgi:hypothetical protein
MPRQRWNLPQEKLLFQFSSLDGFYLFTYSFFTATVAELTLHYYRVARCQETTKICESSSISPTYLSLIISVSSALHAGRPLTSPLLTSSAELSVSLARCSGLATSSTPILRRCCFQAAIGIRTRIELGELVTWVSADRRLKIAKKASIGNNQTFINKLTLRPPHTWAWGPVFIALQALSSVEEPEPVQVRFTLCLRDQQSKWMQRWM